MLAAGMKPQPTVSPNPGGNQVDAVGQVSKSSIAKEILHAHASALEARRGRDLVSEMLALHIDGTGDFQWAVIVNDAQVEIPRSVSRFRKTENLLRPIVDNAVNHHTTMPINYHVDSLPDRKAREKALIDRLWANNLARSRGIQGIYAEALYAATAFGFCPVHAYWRDDVSEAMYEPIGPASEEEHLQKMMQAMDQGFSGSIDVFSGNPGGTVFDLGAKKGSVKWCSYERWLSADLVRKQFGHMPGVAGLQGSTRINSSAAIQQIMQSWTFGSIGINGSSVIRSRNDRNEEMVLVICREIAPGLSQQYPAGRLQLIAVPGAHGRNKGQGARHAILLADQPLPGRCFSWQNFYSHHRGTDIHGKAWAEDLDELQVSLNIAKSARWEAVKKQMDAPIVSPGQAIDDDMRDLDGYNLMEISPTLANWRPRVMEYSQTIVPALDNEIRELRQAMYTIGGYQAVSRGESLGSRTPYRSIVALQQADSTIHGPVHLKYQEAATAFMQICWKQMKAFGDIPWIMQFTGDEYGHLTDAYIDKTRLSERPPDFRLVDSFGVSAEMKGQEVLQLMQVRGADGQPFLTTADARRLYPNQNMFSIADDPAQVQRRRAKVVAAEIEKVAKNFRQQSGFSEDQIQPEQVGQVLKFIAYQLVFQGLPGHASIESRFPRRRDDDPHAHIAALTEIAQDPTADPLAQEMAEFRQQSYFDWLLMAAGGQPQEGGQQAPQAPSLPSIPGGGAERREIAAEFQGGGDPGMSPQAEMADGPMVAMTAR